MTTRAQPAKSWDAAWRHLFRHIDEPKELRRNPIARDFLRGAAHADDCDERAVRIIRNFIVETLGDEELSLLSLGNAERARRRRAIVEQHILAHRPARTIAGELHISRMQLYRERRAICERLARALTEAGHRRRRLERVSDAQGAALAHAKALVHQFAIERAISLTDDLACNAAEPQARIEALCTGADALTAELEFDAAQRGLNAARAMLSSNAAQLGESLTLYAVRLEFATARLAMAKGLSREARRISAAALDELRRQSLCDERERSIAFDELMQSATLALREGRFRQFREHFSAAHAVYGGLQEPRPAQKAQLFLLAGLLFEERSENESFGNARRMLATAADTARRNGLLALELDATLSAAGVLAYGAGDTEGALREAQPALAAVFRTRNRPLIGTACPFVAVIHNERREFAAAATLVELGLRHGSRDVFADGAMHAIAAHTYFGLGNYARAGRHAGEAAKLATRLGNRRMRGAVLRISALMHHARRDADACDEIEEAVDLLERHGSWDSLRQAYRASAAITGNKEHARRVKLLTARASEA
ncbi:MAG: hypothetical protein JO078_01600 [Candidatus Eremiobacteraeota bacterium]|nr:hypothetical protein [Candidatus Eremiobacteraeota bacterium]MBV9056886.1 hypothetical protein [Candidatus Eremiobacteraeota bacterium]MBV9698797.1 hypothetical protein [Candidatus Eremiobacteraeota bacterium]